MLTILICLIILRAPANATDEPPAPEPAPARIKAFLETCETARRGAIVQQEHTLRGLRSQQTASPAVARRIVEVEDDLRVLRANKEPVVPTLIFPPETGGIGRLPRLSCHVDQILGDKEMLVRCFFTLKVPAVRHFQIHAETVVRPVNFLIRGIATKNLHEGTDTELLGVFEIKGQQSYRTVQGSTQTALVITPFDMKSVEPFFRAAASKAVVQ
ncbi:MAG: hypothetical protein HY288_18290 [Planctomycetia bacterium]|nr:hypothetical protein [Planctomycetia bacterium]